MKRKWKSPAHKAKVSAAISTASDRPDYHSKRVAASKANWNKPGYRKAVTASAAKLAHDTRVNRKRRSSMKRKWKSRGYRERVGASMSRKYLSPDYQARNLAGRLRVAESKGIFVSPASGTAVKKRPGPDPTPFEQTVRFRIGKEIEDEISARGERSKATIVAVRSSVTAKHKASYETIKEYHGDYLKWEKARA
jgi:hypothetical protein